jgi:hypothetical protein
MSKQGRADGSAWYERSIRNRKIAGSNPAQSIAIDRKTAYSNHNKNLQIIKKKKTKWIYELNQS